MNATFMKILACLLLLGIYWVGNALGGQEFSQTLEEAKKGNPTAFNKFFEIYYREVLKSPKKLTEDRVNIEMSMLSLFEELGDDKFSELLSKQNPKIEPYLRKWFLPAIESGKKHGHTYPKTIGLIKKGWKILPRSQHGDCQLDSLLMVEVRRNGKAE